MAKIKIDANLYERVRKIAEKAGYASPEDFIIHVLERELSVLETAETDAQVSERLKGLGYLE